MTSKLPPNAFDRESRILLQRLAKSRKGLHRATTGGDTEWRLSGKRHTPIPAVLIEMMRARSLLIELPDGSLRASAAGLRLVVPAPPQQSLLEQHALIEPPSAPRSPRLNRTECAVHWLGNRLDKSGKPLLSPAQFAAAERIRLDFECAQLGPCVTANWDRPIGPDGSQAAPPDPSERAIAAKTRFFKALDAVGPELSGIIVEVCCLAAGIEQAERRLTLPARSGKAVLQLALTGLARHYGFVQHAQDPHKRLNVRSWGTSDYRPTLPGI